jgi:hypothetical protein
MAWMIISEDSAEATGLRADQALMDAHWAYELAIRDRILAAGSLRDDDGRAPVGSLLIPDVATKDEALALLAGDPATMAGLRGKVTARYWNPAVLGGVVQD